jgi:uncharacterized protein GlcG (DUF336 family)
MHLFPLAAVAAAVGLAFASAVQAQPAPPPDYGPPVTQGQAMKIAVATQAKAKELGQRVVITIVGPAGDLIYFTKMDGAQYGSIAVSQQKAKTATLFRRPTKVFEELMGKGGPSMTLMTLPNVIASAGGLPILIDGKIVGAIGVSGSPMGSIDEQAALAGLEALK